MTWYDSPEHQAIKKHRFLVCFVSDNPELWIFVFNKNYIEMSRIYIFFNFLKKTPLLDVNLKKTPQTKWLYSSTLKKMGKKTQITGNLYKMTDMI